MEPLIIIAGPTAVGKSDLAVRVAQKYNGSIISCDSMQVYKEMNIGTAKIKSEETGGIEHYLIDILDPFEEFNIVMFKQMANDAIRRIRREGRIPIMVGGTGFYIQSVLYDTDFDECIDDPDYRQSLWELIDEKGAKHVHDMLEDIDPKAAANISVNDHKRLVRALEYNHQTGGLISKHNEENRTRKPVYNHCFFVLTDERSRIYGNIDKRVDKMIGEGLVEEVESLMQKGLRRENISMQGLGYKEIIDHLSGEISLEEAVYRIKRDSRHFAKRQLTWFRRERDVIWLDKSLNTDIMSVIDDELKKKGIINE